jgi:hypothetical protein
VPDDVDLIELNPLTALEVRRVLADHLPAEEAERVAGSIHARTGGWPGAVHRAAVDAARDLAVNRVGAAATLTGATSAELASARAELVDSVAELRDTTAPAEAPDPRICPWRGLASYALEDARWFARDEVAEALAKGPDSASFVPPPPQAIAYSLLQWWLEERT